MDLKLKKILSDVVPPVLFRMIKKIIRGRYMAKDELDKKLEKYLTYKNGFFIELGANNGLKESNTYYYEKYKSWRGILIEPSPNKFIECKTNRSTDNSFFCCACVSFDFKEEFVKIVYSNLMSAPVNIESDLIDPTAHALKGEVYLPENEQIFEFGAKAIPLQHLLVASKAPKIIDLLSLDVEGAELEVLKGINHNEYRFKFMLIECRNYKRLETYLTSLGYSLLEKLSHHDYLFTNDGNK